MAYTPTTWQSGDTITSAKLNKLEAGVQAAGNTMIVHVNGFGSMDKTWKEISDAIGEGTFVYVVNSTESGAMMDFVCEIGHSDEDGYYIFMGNGYSYGVSDGTENGYPENMDSGVK